MTSFLPIVAGEETVINPNPPVYETYSCAEQEATCGKDTDRYYELIAGYYKYWIPNFPSIEAINEEDYENKDGAYWQVRTVIGGEGFDDSDRNENVTLGPTMVVKPGETMAILMRNNVPADTPPVENQLLQVELDPDWWLAGLNASNPDGSNYGIQSGGFVFQGPTPTSMDQVSIPNEENIPHMYNHLNLHLHGMVIQPHLFFPQGTMEAEAEWVSAGPGECYCYQFYVPEDHPTGTYWYHTHRHGSSAMWTWAQTAGLIDVQGTFGEEVNAQGVSREIPFVVTDQYLKPSENPEDENTYVVNDFVDMQTDVTFTEGTQVIVNGANRPTYEMQPGETVWLRYLSGVVNILNEFQIEDEDGNVFPVYDAASDGINYKSPVLKDSFVNGGGMRQDIMLQFPEAGVYSVWTKNLLGVQFFGLGPADQLMATFNVTGEPVENPIDVPNMQFSLPEQHKTNIDASEITKSRIVTFDITGDTTVLPFPQFKVNGVPFELDRIMYDLELDGHSEEWILISTTNVAHPFHLHVLPFQVMAVFSGYNGTTNTQTVRTMEEIGPYPQWRDTVVVPPYGQVRIWIRFEPAPLVDLNGKSVFHCHMLAHEDTGMITAIRFNDPLTSPGGSNGTDGGGDTGTDDGNGGDGDNTGGDEQPSSAFRKHDHSQFAAFFTFLGVVSM
eukprot:CAMPEP_0113500606 /NCGR_PEP_ID=MMETSP0014_2-20120614/32433_1 /TAXON_ID=2857 /ORGANISM="Nitzschia sp." /LENGTH=669 /DNA_ID=CAMNT_0000394983 /DNA_START=103 /DNA_END=2109 /DNA_ORIENTATION=+ /assembly_acc=CAM_ASM_000159